MDNRAQRARQVTILLTNQLSMFEFSSALELFALPRPELDPWYETRVVSLIRSSYPALGSTVVHCEHISRLPEAELLVIPSYSIEPQAVSKTLVEAVREHHARGGRTISFCSGSFLLAEAGLLDGRVATTHWRYAEEFQRRFPGIRFDGNILYAYDGTVGCSAGSSAGIDLGTEVIRQDFGHRVANSVARRLVLPAHRSGGQSQFVEKPISYRPTSISRAMDWAVRNLSRDVGVEAIAAQANMTRRTFDRQFRKFYNMTPAAWLAERKLEVAKGLLETTDSPIEQIALQSGYESAVTLRQNFKKSLSISPSEYRQKFGNGQRRGLVAHLMNPAADR